MEEINVILISFFKEGKNEKNPFLIRLNKRNKLDEKIFIKEEEKNNNQKFLNTVDKFITKENKKIYKRQESKFKFCCSIIIFIISIISYSTCHKKTISQESSITLKFSGGGKHNVFYSGKILHGQIEFL